ncbi:PP0621 family protein [Hydrogenovibrio kuenenii]|uniref:PP0621 family protein n=1 Tax=Hydrogenovibrio kuenenii TaxID=63658 RepID=UPI00046308DD|nr:PP0621 family protein [Hydrogenovibrio kuenenii]
MKSLLLLVIAFGVFLLVRFIMKRVNEIQQDETTSSRDAQNNYHDGNAERMITCAECGLRLPESEAILLDATTSVEANQQLAFCSQEHKRLYLEKHPDA